MSRCSRLGRDPALQGVALGVDPRERLFFPQWPRIFAELDAQEIVLK